MVSFAPAGSPAAPASNVSRFAPDATTVFASKGDLLRLGELELTANAVVNFTRGQLASEQPLVEARQQPAGAAVVKAVGQPPSARLYQRSAEEVARLLEGRINAPLPRLNVTGPRPEKPAEGEAWALPVPNRPSGASVMGRGRLCIGCRYQDSWT
jgi:hypothetical protein